jgi:hypothetical protein
LTGGGSGDDGLRDGPSKVRDGLISALSHRPLWSFRLTGAILDRAGEVLPDAAVLIGELRSRKARVIVLGDPAMPLPEPIAAQVERQADLPFRDLLEELGAAPAELVHVGPDRQRDVELAMRAGVRAVWLEPTPTAPVRGVLRVESLVKLRDILTGATLAVRSGSTYHEI